MNITIKYGNIIEAETEVIVNSWNRNIIPWFLLIPMGVSGAIKRSAGFRPFNELLKFGPIPLGEARLTSAGRLNYRAIVHVAGINIFWQSSERAVRKSIQSSMDLVKSENFKSISFPVIGSGSGSFNEEQAFKIMKDELNQISSPAEVHIIRYQKKGFWK